MNIYGMLIKAGADSSLKASNNYYNHLDSNQAQYMTDLLSVSAKDNDAKAAINILKVFPVDKRIELAKETLQTLTKNNNIDGVKLLIKSFPDQEKELLMWSRVAAATKGLAEVKLNTHPYDAAQKIAVNRNREAMIRQ